MPPPRRIRADVNYLGRAKCVHLFPAFRDVDYTRNMPLSKVMHLKFEQSRTNDVKMLVEDMTANLSPGKKA